MEKGSKLYEGKAKILFETKDKDELIQYFKDDATAFDATKRGTINSKGICNNRISSRLFEYLIDQGVPTHFIRMLSEREMLVSHVNIIPIEVTIRNIVAGGMAKLLGLEEGMKLKIPVLEYHYKSDPLHDPLINHYHVLALDIAQKEEMDIIDELSFKINEKLIAFFSSRSLDLVDFKLEFGKTRQGKIVLADEISPDTCRLWDKTTRRKMDKDRFRRDLGQIEETYQEVAERILS